MERTHIEHGAQLLGFAFESFFLCCACQGIDKGAATHPVPILSSCLAQVSVVILRRASL